MQIEEEELTGYESDELLLVEMEVEELLLVGIEEDEELGGREEDEELLTFIEELVEEEALVRLDQLVLFGPPVEF